MDISAPAAGQVSKIVLVGAPNVGKSSLFNALTGLNQRVGNFPGVTVERKSGNLSLDSGQKASLVDLPGTNSLYPTSEDEAIACDVLRNPSHPDYPDRVVVVADATQLKRAIVLCSQVIDMGFPTILALNMIDLMEREYVHFATARLQQELGIPVVAISVRQNKGLGRLKSLLSKDLAPALNPWMKLPPGLKPALSVLREKGQFLNDYQAFQALLNPEGFSHLPSHLMQEVRELAHTSADDLRLLVANELAVRNDRAGELTESVRMRANPASSRISARLDQLLTHRVAGYAIFLGILFLIFQSIFAWATYPMDAIEAGVNWLSSGLRSLLPAGVASDLLTEGIIPGFGGIIVFIPQIAFLFFFIALLEESGYMARVVFLMDRIVRPFGFSGKSIIPLMGGMACAIPSIMMTRSIPNKFERVITIAVIPLMSCSARIPVYTLLIALFVPAERLFGFDVRGFYMTGLYLLGFVTSLLVAYVLKLVLKYKSDGLFMLELPDYRMPRWRNVGIRVFQQAGAFVTGAGRIILIISIVLWFLSAYGPSQKMDAVRIEFDQLALASPDNPDLERQKSQALMEASFAGHIGKFIEPAIRPLGFDWKIGISLVTSFAAREVFVSTMSVLYGQEDPGDDEAAQRSLLEKMRAEINPRTGKPVYSHATALSLLIFYAFAMQCMSTLAVTKKEAGWKWAIIVLVYLTLLAYGASWITYTLAA